MGTFPRELSDRREVFDRVAGRCQCTRPGICHTPHPPFLAGRCSRTFEFWMDGWVVEYIKPLHKGGADEVGNKHLLCRECFEEKRH